MLNLLIIIVQPLNISFCPNNCALVVKDHYLLCGDSNLQAHIQREHIPLSQNSTHYNKNTAHTQLIAPGLEVRNNLKHTVSLLNCEELKLK